MLSFQFKRNLAYTAIVGILTSTILLMLPSRAAALPAKIGYQSSTTMQMVSPSVISKRSELSQYREHSTRTSISYSYLVQPGDTLSLIAARLYDNTAYWPAIYRANRNHIQDFNTIFVGQRLTIPPKPATIPSVPSLFTTVSSNPNPPPVPVSGAAGVAVAYAYAQLGCPYVWGGNGPCSQGFDCSGLMQQAWLHAGIDIPRVSWDQINSLPAVSLNSLRPGDILGMYGNSHVGMYVGKGMMIDAPHPGAVVERIPVPWGVVDAAVRP